MSARPAIIDKKVRTSFSLLWILLASGLVVTIWLGAPALARHVGLSLTPGQNPTSLGQVGDSYGLATSLFSGAGFVGIALVLWFDMRQRSETRAPLLSFEPPSRLDHRNIDAGADKTTLSFAMNMPNVTVEPALNVRVGAWLHENESEKYLAHIEAMAPHVVVGNDSISRRSVAIDFELRGQKKRSLDDLMDRHTGFSITISATYGSITGVEWATVCTYLVQRLQTPAFDANFEREGRGDVATKAGADSPDLQSGHFDGLIGSVEVPTPGDDIEAIADSGAHGADQGRSWVVTPAIGKWEYGQPKKSSASK